MKPYSLIILAFLFTLIACSSPIRQDLADVPNYIDDKPDSALVVLRNIDESELSSEKEKAFYYLFLTKAEDKNYIDTEDATEIEYAAKYYDKYGPEDLRMLAWYYDGIVNKNAREYTTSIVALEKAERSARKINDFFYLGLILRNKATVFSLTNNNPSAIDARAASIECFEKAGKNNYTQFARLSLAIDYVNDKNYNNAEEIASQLVQSEIACVAHQARLLLADIWTVKYSYKPDSLIAIYQGIPKRFFDITDYCNYAKAFELAGIKDSADFYISRAHELSINNVQSATVDYMFSDILQMRGDYVHAFPLLKNALETQDSLTRNLLSQSISIAQREYYKGELGRQELETRIQSQKKSIYLLGGILAVCTLAAALLSMKRKKDEIIKEKIYLLASSQVSSNDNAASLVGQLLNLRMEGMEALSKQYIETDDRKKKSKILSEFWEKRLSLEKDKALFQELEKDLDKYCDGVMSKFKAQFPSMGKDRFTLVSLFFAKIPFPKIMSITNSLSIESIKSAKTRIRKEIEASEAEDKDLFLNLLKAEKGRPRNQKTD